MTRASDDQRLLHSAGAWRAGRGGSAGLDGYLHDKPIGVPAD